MHCHLETFWQQLITKKSDCLCTKQSFKICLRIVNFWNKRLLNLRETQHHKEQRRWILINKRPTYHSQIDPSFSKRGHFCGIKYSYNILDQVQNHFCWMPGQRFKLPKLQNRDLSCWDSNYIDVFFYGADSPERFSSCSLFLSSTACSLTLFVIASSRDPR